MSLYTIRRLWTSLLIVGVPAAALAIAWAIFMHGRPVAGVLAACYLMIAAAGRARAVQLERRARPIRAERVRTQIERVRSTLVFDEPGDGEPHLPFAHDELTARRAAHPSVAGPTAHAV